LDGILNEDGDAGCDLRLFANRDDMAHPDRSVRTLRLCDSSALISDDIPEDLKNRPWFAVMTGTWTAPVSGAYEFSLSVCGRARLFIDNLLVVDNWDILQRPGDGFFGQGTIEELGVVDINKGQDYQIRCEYGNVAGAKIGQEVKDESQPIHNFGLRVGGFPVVDQDRELQDAVAMAQGSDAVVLVVGLGPDFESEAFDRPDLSLPMRTNELIERVAAVNERTVVVIQSVSASTYLIHQRG
jgi:beta-glucosidase